MSLFAPANEVYKTYFGTSPPSRATVAVPLPESGRVRLEVLGFDDRPNVSDSSDLSSSEERNAKNEEGLIGGRQALHVQGLSYWAPANIGPYSQAIIVSDFMSRKQLLTFRSILVFT
jgi:diphthine-ammonia ligase